MIQAELAELIWQALARHGTLLDDIERRSVERVLSFRVTPLEDLAQEASLELRDLAEHLKSHSTPKDGGLRPTSVEARLWAADDLSTRIDALLEPRT